MRLTRCSDKNFLNDIAIRYLDRDYQYQHYFTLFHNTIVSHNDIMTGSLGMGRPAQQSAVAFVQQSRRQSKPRGDQMPHANFLNDILFEIIDSNGQLHRQHSVLYDITNVFIAISIIIETMKRVKIGTYGHHS